MQALHDQIRGTTYNVLAQIATHGSQHALFNTNLKLLSVYFRALADEEEMGVVQNLVETLPSDYRQAEVLRYWYDMSYEEIAEVMETTVSAIKSRLFRARRQLAKTGVQMGIVTTPEVEAVT